MMYQIGTLDVTRIYLLVPDHKFKREDSRWFPLLGFYSCHGTAFRWIFYVWFSRFWDFISLFRKEL